MQFNEQPKGAYVGKETRFFDKKGNEIDHDPIHDGQKVEYRDGKKRPLDYLQITRSVYKDMVAEPFGNNLIETFAYGPIEKKMYVKFVWENDSWYPVICKTLTNGVESVRDEKFIATFTEPDLSKL